MTSVFIIAQINNIELKTQLRMGTFLFVRKVSEYCTLVAFLTT